MKQHENKENNTWNAAQASLEPFTGNFALDLERVRKEIGHNSDVHFREFQIGGTGICAAIIFVDGLSDKELIDKHIMKSLMMSFSENHHQEPSIVQGAVSKEYIKNQVLTIGEVTEAHHAKELASKILTGSTALLMDGVQNALILGTTKGKSRNMEEPSSEPLVRGPRLGFTESLRDNTALLRQQGGNSNLSILKFQVGERSKKELVIAYIKDLADPALVEEVRERIKKINIDDVPESGYVEQLIEDNYLSPFPQVQNTERPDRVYSALMEGRVAILLDGTPFALIVPVSLSMMLHSPEDYYDRWIPSFLIRLLRYFAAIISLFGPSLYISFVSFHQGLIPTKLALSIMGTREGVPFPAIIEALIMEVSIEILREGGLRLPRPIGPAMGIVGGLVIGEAAVQAGIISPIMVIVVALTAISSFAVPQYSAGISFRMLRFVAMFFAAVYGLYGVVLFFLFLCSHLVRLKSFGVPFITPVVPYRVSDWKDLMIRMPLVKMRRFRKAVQKKDSMRKG